MKEEIEGQVVPVGGKIPQVEDHMYMKVRFILFYFP